MEGVHKRSWHSKNKHYLMIGHHTPLYFFSIIRSYFWAIENQILPELVFHWVGFPFRHQSKINTPIIHEVLLRYLAAEKQPLESNTGYLGATVLPLGFWSYGYHFLIESWGLFTWNTSCEKIKVRRVTNFFRRYVPFFQISTGILTVETKLASKKLRSKAHLQSLFFFNSYICFIPLRPPQKHPNFDGFVIYSKN